MYKKVIFLLLYTGIVHYSFSGNHSSIEYLFPPPGSCSHPAETVIILRFKDIHPSQIMNINSLISVHGKKSGQVNGKTVISTDKKTIIFKPLSAYLPGDIISVRIHPKVRGDVGNIQDISFHFTVSLQVNQQTGTGEKEAGIQKQNISSVPILRKQNNGDPVVINGVSVPADFPMVDITVNDNPDSGYIFLNTSWNSTVHYSMILDNTGTPLYYRRTPDNQQDFKVQPDGRLTMLNDPGFFDRQFIAMDSTYTVVDYFIAPPGYYVDEHELQVLTNGHYLLIAKNDSIVDMSKLISGGDPNAIIRGNSVAEMDADDNPVFIWRSWEHFNILDAVHENLYANTIDYVHMNAIDLDLDGNILISSRHLSEITKINRTTGEIIWRLGGENDDFTWVNDDDRISYQHNITVLPDGHYMVFDNGNYHNPPFSRALEFSVDTTSWTVTKIWEYPEEHDIYTGWMGNAQRLPGGNTVICWADFSLPKLTEVRLDGSKAFELDFMQSFSSYRSFRFPWKGKAAVPALIIEPYSSGIILLFNKFGDEDIVQYNIYGGQQPAPDEIIATSGEPFIHLSDLINKTTYYFRVTTVNSEGHESGFSNEENVYVNIITPGENMVQNGDFSDGFNYWAWWLGEGTAHWEITPQQELHINIEEGGTEIWYVQVLHPGIQLIHGKTYLFEFDAYATQDRLIRAEISKDGSPWTIYSRIGLTYITTGKTRYSYQFVMEDASELSARIEFGAGIENADVYLDNISFKEVLMNDGKDRDNKLIHNYSLSANYPNPFNQETIIQYEVPLKSIIEFRIFNILGQEVRKEIFKTEAGNYQYRFNPANLSSGVYLYQIKAESVSGGMIFNRVRKMILLR